MVVAIRNVAVSVLLGLLSGGSVAGSSAEIAARVAAEEYRFTWSEEAWSAPNRAHGFRTLIRPDGIAWVSREQGEGGFRVALSAPRLRRGDSIAPLPDARLRVQDDRVFLDRGTVEEWLHNSPEGAKHGFTIAEPPEVLGAGRGRLVLEMQLEGSAEADAAGEAVWFSRGARRVLRYAELVVFDARGAVLPARLQVRDSTLAIEIDDAGASYPIEIDPLATSPSQSLGTQQTASDFGISVATAGDVNNDGYWDLLVGAPRFDGGQRDEGRVFLYLGTPGGLAATPITVESNESDAQFGSAVASGGDVNGDGFHDILIGCPKCGADDRGLAYLYAGATDVKLSAPVWQDDFAAAPVGFGQSVAFAGDVNGDNFADILVGAPLADDRFADEGATVAYLGASTWPTTTPQWTRYGGIAFGRCGEAVATAGDVNADGFQDVAAGCPGQTADPLNLTPGTVRAYLGTSTGVSTAIHRSWTGEENGALFGRSVATAGDIDADGYADLVIGSPGLDCTIVGDACGKVYLYRGGTGGLPAIANSFVSGTLSGSDFGHSVAIAGDVNGDGFADVAVGIPELTSGGAGRVQVYLGSSGGTLFGAKQILGNQAGSGFGRSVATAGDVDGDGFSDLAVGAPSFDGPDGEGRAFVYFGGPEPPASFRVFGTGDVGTHRGGDMASGDFNGDGYSDVVIRRQVGGLDSVLVYSGSASGPQDPPLTLESGSTGLAAADVNGDGYDDLLVGFATYSNGETQEGRLAVFHGSAAGLPTVATYSRELNVAGEQFGFAVGAAGDVNGDGFPDVVVGGPGFVSTEPAGRFHLFLGSASGLGAAPHQTFTGVVSSISDIENRKLGHAVSTAGDFNADGYADVVVGDPGYYYDRGEIRIYRGGPAGLQFVQSSSGSQDGAECGRAVAHFGDYDGDGFSDIAAGCPGITFVELGEGAVRIYLGDAAVSLSSFLIFGGGEYGGAFGRSIAGATDLDADGRSDLIVSTDDEADDAGRVKIWLGNPAASFSERNPDFEFEGTSPGERFAGTVEAAGDVNGDGFGDFLASSVAAGGSNYRTILYFGGGRDGVDRLARQRRFDDTAPIGLHGASETSNSFKIRSLGRCITGRDDIRMEHEASDVAVPLDGANLARGGFFDSGVVDAQGSAINFTRSVSGLTFGPNYHWRFRFVCRSPLAGPSPWITHPGNGATEKDLRTTCTAQTYYRDEDGDGYGALAKARQFCSPPPGYVATSNDCDDANPSRFPGNPELCDGLDNNCNSVVDDPAVFPAPGATPELTASKSGGSIQLQWSAIAGADRYDVVRADLGSLRIAGSWFSAVETCVANDVSSGPVGDATVPPSNAGDAYVARAVNCRTAGSYGSGDARERPRFLDDSPNTCP